MSNAPLFRARLFRALVVTVFGLAGALLAASALADETPGEASDPPKSSKEAAPALPEDAPQANDESKPSPAGPKYDLKYKFSPGEVIRTAVVHRATVQTSIQGTTQTAETLSKSTKAWRVREVDDAGNITFEHQVDKIDMWQRTQGRKEIRYNSETDSEVPPGYEEVAKAVGVPLSIITMDNRGKILKRQEKTSQPMGQSTQMTLPLPEQPVAVGESWSSPMTIDVTKDGATKKIETRQKFTLEQVSDDVATIAIDMQVLTPVHDPAIEAQLIQRMSSGTAWFDIAAGRILAQQLDLDRRVIGFSGPSSSMHYLTRFTEQLVREAPQNAAAETPKTAAAPKKPTASTGKAAAPPSARPANPAAKKTAPPRR